MCYTGCMWKTFIILLTSMVEPTLSILDTMPTVLPVQGTISSDYGWRISPITNKKGFHVGIDIVALLGDPIISPADGVVLRVGSKKRLGNYIILSHAGAITTKYGHLDEILVEEGEEVKRGTQIATIGISGTSTGAHLHYEVLVEGQNVNPLSFYLPFSSNPK